MLLKSYTKNYIFTYLWQGVAMVLHLISLMIVIPFISENKLIFGIYSICISVSIFLNYADLGFVSAGIKYAGEYYAKNEYKEEVKYYGFSAFILLILVSFIVITFLLFSYNPQILIKDVFDPEALQIASSLLFIQALFSFNIILQKYVSGVFQVRIEQYVFQRINIIGNIIKISSVFYFFGYNNYDIVSYFFFIKLIELLVLITGVFLIKKRYNIFIKDFISNVKFDKTIYKKTKDLAYSSFFITILWIIYYELDIIIIGKIFGANEVAVFSIAYVFMQFLRSLSGILFSPFQNRYNHFIGLNDFVGLKKIFKKVIFITTPIFLFGVLIIVFFSDNLILSWAGSQYSDSALILVLLSLCHFFNSIIIPGSNLLVSLEKITEMYLINLTIVIVFWLGIYLTYEELGLISFPFFKLISTLISAVFYLNFLLKFLDKSIFYILLKILKNLFIPTLVLCICLINLLDFLPIHKSNINFIIVFCYSLFSISIAFISLFLTSKYYKKEFKIYFTKVLNIIK